MPQAAVESFPFDIGSALSRTLLNDAPAVVLVLFFLIGRKRPEERGVPRPGKRDALIALAALGALVLIAAATGFLASLLPGGEAVAGIEAPRTLPGWAVVLVSCAVTGYLEEGFFRAYVITRLGDIGVEGLRAVVVSVVLFSLCHLYEGPWGVVNAAMAGSALSVAFIRGRSLHGPAWAHGAYNAFVYLWAL